MFTNGSDLGAVKTLYRKMSIAQLGGIEELDFDGMRSPTVAEMQQLGRCFRLDPCPPRPSASASSSMRFVTASA